MGLPPGRLLIANLIAQIAFGLLAMTICLPSMQEWGALFGARQSGRNAERIQQMRKTIEVQRDQLEAASRRPRDRDELIDRMRDGSF